MATNLYLLDTNYILRAIVGGTDAQVSETEKLFESAKKGKCRLVILTEVFLEVEYVLRKVYKMSNTKVGVYLQHLLDTSFFTLSDREILKTANAIYSELNVDFVDVLLFVKATVQGGIVKTFDKDFVKIKKIYDKLS